ncbi:unnamed protein product [Miscanthus lutarioriparius]|uniref:DUF641 domain-containing protein n=2 Tax=Miscanthus lutarioriparius TaxID=422564 RepID=A0A811RZR4_9POAL|nr:unnamed protein product [Miscanthus lutarioriparius]
METMAAAPAPQQRTGRIARRLARLLRRKSSPAGAGGMAYSVAGDDFDDSLDSSINSLSKLKLSGNLAAAYTLDAFFKNATETKGTAAAAPQTQPSPAPAPVPAPGAQDAAKHAFVATLFARASAVKAAYAQLQLAQHPYDADSIQAADAGLVAELTKLSSLKRRYARDPAAAASRTAAAALALAAHADEQRHLLRTYEITARKLEAELRARDAEAERARAALADEVRAARGLEERTRTLASLDDLHLSGLNATHFLTALRHAVKSVRAFASAMLHAMRAAGWDPAAAAAAAAAVHPGARLRDPAGDARFALESYVALKMFAGFHRKDLGLSSLHGRGASHDRRRFFEEFAEAKSAAAAELLVQDDAGRWGALREFLRDRYVCVVHKRMEAAFFGGASSSAVPRAAWLGEFAEMARRVWLLHCLFWAFDGAASVFQARPGDRFSEVFMESVSDADGGGTTPVPAQAPSGHLAVGFTVVPGFQLGRTVIQCRVYLSHSEHRP